MEYFDLGSYSLPVTTSSKEAQTWFDRGLNWTFGYNHNEAVACFEKAAEADPDCAMAHWGIAYAAGPNYNLPWDLYDDKTRARALATAYDATQMALEKAGSATATEQALINALPARYPKRDPDDDQNPWNDAFADAMREAHKAHPESLDVRTIFVEAMMNRTPWKMWDLKKGVPAENADTLECQTVLEEVLDGDEAAVVADRSRYYDLRGPWGIYTGYRLARLSLRDLWCPVPRPDRAGAKSRYGHERDDA